MSIRFATLSFRSYWINYAGKKLKNKNKTSSAFLRIDPFAIISYLSFNCSMSLSLLCMVELYSFSDSRNLIK